MASNHTVLMRLVASAYSIAQKAGNIVRCVIAEGDLGIVQKVLQTFVCSRSRGFLFFIVGKECHNLDQLTTKMMALSRSQFQYLF